MNKCPFCDTPLSKHPAGQCLDAWIALLDGWTMWRYTLSGMQVVSFYGPGILPWAGTRDKTAKERFQSIAPGEMQFREIIGFPPESSGTWAGAGRLLDQMKEGKACPSLFSKGGCWQTDYKTGKVSRNQWGEEYPLRDGQTGDTGPLAVARAFVAWKKGLDE